MNFLHSLSLFGFNKSSINLDRERIQRQWRDQKFKDKREELRREAENLERELYDRSIARHYRTIADDELRRFRFKLEGLVLERRVPPRVEFPELPLAAREIVKYIWNKNASHTEVIANAFGANITRKDLLTLSGTEWLNDEVINFFINLVVERNREDSNLPQIYAFNTFFYQKLFQSGYSGVKRWTRKIDIFSFRMLIVPIHMGNHWCMSVVDFEKKRVDYYDSLLGNNQQCLELLRNYLIEECMDKKKLAFDVGDWTFDCLKEIPYQRNLWDCGMFACLYAEYASRRAAPTFDQKHIPYFRERMTYEIYQKKLL